MADMYHLLPKIGDILAVDMRTHCWVDDYPVPLLLKKRNKALDYCPSFIVHVDRNIYSHPVSLFGWSSSVVGGKAKRNG